MTEAESVSGDESTSIVYYHDEKGNLITKQKDDEEIIRYTYDFYNRLTGVSQGDSLSVSYTYDALNRRSQKTWNGESTSYVWDGDNLVYETGTNTQRYQYAHGLVGLGASKRQGDGSIVFPGNQNG